MSDITAAQAVSESWTALLGSPPAGSDDFFDAGGDSLKAALLLAAIRHRVGVLLPLRVVLENPTFDELSGRLALAMPAQGTEAHRS